MDNPSVFISHSSSNSAIAQDICCFLESHGVRCWIAPRDIQPGAEYPSEITRGIKECPIFLVILTKESVYSPHVNTETDIAFNANKRIIPFFADNVDLGDSMSYYLARKQWIPGYKDYRHALQDLLNYILNQPDIKTMTSAGMQTNMNHSTDRPSYYINPLRVSFQTKAYSAKIQTIFKRYRVLFIAVSATLAVIILLWGLYLAYDSYLTRKRIYTGLQNEYKYQSEYDTVQVINESKNVTVVPYADNMGQQYNDPTYKLSTDTKINGVTCEATWYLKDMYITPDINGLIEYTDTNSLTKNFNCKFRLHKKSLEGVIEDYDGANIGYFDGKIYTDSSGFLIIGEIVICELNENNSYSHLPCEIKIISDKETDKILTQEMTKAL